MNISAAGALLMCFLILQSCSAQEENLDFYNDLMEFCSNNGQRYVAFLDESRSPVLRTYLLHLSSLRNIRVRFYDSVEDIEPTFVSGSNIDTLVLFKNDLIDYETILEIANRRRIKKTIVIIRQKSQLVSQFSIEIENFKAVAENFAQNSLFYLMEVDDEVNWYTVMTLYGSSKISMNKLTFDELGIAIEDYNLNGLEIVATSLGKTEIILLFFTYYLLNEIPMF